MTATIKTPEDRQAFNIVYGRLQRAAAFGDKISDRRLAQETIDILRRLERLKVEIDEEGSNLCSHARRELKLLGEESETVEGYMAMIRIFAAMGHSGGSASVFIPTLQALTRFENLTELTDNPAEWNHIAEDKWGVEDGIWQSQRRSDAFSNDGGKTYYLLSEGGNDKNRGPMHDSKHVEV